MEQLPQMKFFNDMTYKEKYYKIINSGLIEKPETGYYEHHHIIPRSVCILLDKSQDNLVYLTAKNHFLAHYYIWKWFRDELKEKSWSKKMCFALIRMKQQLIKSDDIEKLSDLYDEVRKDFSKVSSEANKGKNNPMWGKHLSIETKKKISKAFSGEKNPMWGKHLSDETRRKISEAHLGTKLSNETKRKLSEALKGKMSGEKHPMYRKHHTQESKMKMSEKHSGEKNHMYGKHHNQESRRKISEIHRKPVVQYSIDGKFIKEFKSVNVVMENINQLVVIDGITKKIVYISFKFNKQIKIRA